MVSVLIGVLVVLVRVMAVAIRRHGVGVMYYLVNEMNWCYLRLMVQRLDGRSMIEYGLCKEPHRHLQSIVRKELANLPSVHLLGASYG